MIAPTSRPRSRAGSADAALVTMTLRIGGTVRVPGDKSISHRALIFSALGAGTSRVRGILQSADVHSTAGVLRSLGISVPELAPDILIGGVDGRGLRPPKESLDCGNS